MFGDFIEILMDDIYRLNKELGTGFSIHNINQSMLEMCSNELTWMDITEITLFTEFKNYFIHIKYEKRGIDSVGRYDIRYYQDTNIQVTAKIFKKLYNKAKLKREKLNLLKDKI